MARKAAKKMAATAAPEVQRMKPVRLDVKASDHQRLERQAERRGLSIAAYVRMLLLEKLEKEEGSK